MSDEVTSEECPCCFGALTREERDHAFGMVFGLAVVMCEDGIPVAETFCRVHAALGLKYYNKARALLEARAPMLSLVKGGKA